MKKIIFIFVFLCQYSITTEAQSRNECVRSLQYASTNYNQGNYRACIRTLDKKCFNTAYLSIENVKKSYKIKIKSYRAIDFDFKAEELYKQFEIWINQNRAKKYNKQEIKNIYNRISTS